MIGLAVLLVAPAVYGVVRVRRGRVRPMVAVGNWVGVAALVMIFLLGQALLTDEGALPPEGLPRSVPAGLVVASPTTECASGGCWREYVVRDVAGLPGEAVAQRLRDAGLGGCARSTWIPDLRVRCVEVEARAGTVVVTDALRGLSLTG